QRQRYSLGPQLNFPLRSELLAHASSLRLHRASTRRRELGLNHASARLNNVMARPDTSDWAIPSSTVRLLRGERTLRRQRSDPSVEGLHTGRGFDRPTEPRWKRAPFT